MNYMKQIAQMLGLELEEEFYIKDKGCKHFRFIRGYARGVMDADPDELICECDDFAYLDEDADECEMYEEVECVMTTNIMKKVNDNVDAIRHR